MVDSLVTEDYTYNTLARHIAAQSPDLIALPAVNHFCFKL